MRPSPAPRHSAAPRLPVFARHVPQRQYTILTSAGLDNTTFSGLITGNQPSGFDASLAYTADDVLLDMTAALGAGSALNVNQQNAANAINAFFNNGGFLPTNFTNLFSLSGSAFTMLCRN